MAATCKGFETLALQVGFSSTNSRLTTKQRGENHLTLENLKVLASFMAYC